MSIDITKYALQPHKVVAVARDTYLNPNTTFADAANLPGVAQPRYGQDITFSYNRVAPGNQSVGTTIPEYFFFMMCLAWMMMT